MASVLMQQLTELHQLTQEAKPTIDYFQLIEKYSKAVTEVSS